MLDLQYAEDANWKAQAREQGRRDAAAMSPLVDYTAVVDDAATRFHDNLTVEGESAKAAITPQTLGGLTAQYLFGFGFGMGELRVGAVSAW